MSNKDLSKLIREYPWYTILFAVYPTVTLLAHNIGEVDNNVAYRAIWFSGLGSILLVTLLYFVYHDLKKAGGLTLLLLFGFFFYGHFFRYIEGWEVNGIVLGRHTYFMVIWFGLFITLTWGFLKSSKIISILTSFLSTVVVFLLALPAYQLVSYQYQTWQNSRQVSPPVISLPSGSPQSYPDIYYIILDMYGRHDVLRDVFSHDDSAFLHNLRELGFYVAECSQSNYPSTAFSLSSALNMNYLTDISDKFTPENTNTTIMWHLIQNSGVETALRGLGYKTVAFETGYRWTEHQDADYYYKLTSNGINDFEDLLLRNSFASVFLEKGWVDHFRLTSDQRKHDLSVYVLEELENIPSLAGSKFVFVHLTIPHPPFVVGPTGQLEVVSPHFEGNESYYIEEEYKIGYINQVAYLNSRIPRVLKSILEESEQPPIIIMQGDHGPRFVEIDKQFDILNAYYFPEPAPEPYPSVSPVNNFRMIFNTYFGASLPLLSDRSYSVGFETPYDFKEIPNDCIVD
jgi:hypothetical protein